MTGIALYEPEAVSRLVERFGGSADEDVRAVRVARVVTPEDASQVDDLVVVTSLRHVARARSATGVILCSPESHSRLPDGRRYRHEHAPWVVAELLRPVAALRDTPLPQASSAAVIQPGVHVGEGTRVHPGAVLLSGARIGRHCEIGPNAVVYGGVQLGARVSVGAGSVLGRPGFGWITAPDGSPRRMPQLGGVVIDDDVEIGALCTVDSGTLGPTRIGARTKLDAHVHVGHNVRIGRDCMVAAQTGFAGSAVLEDGVLVGGQVGVTDHALIGAGARIAAKSGVIGDIPAGATVAGFPAISRWRWLRAMARR